MFWAKALTTATYLVNRCPCYATGTMMPFELLFGMVHPMTSYRFSYHCFPNLMATSHHMPDALSTLCVFIGYPVDHYA